MSDNENDEGARAEDQMAGRAPFSNTQVPLPPKLSIERDMASAWKKWRQIWDSFELVSGLNQRPNKFRVATFVTCIGSDALDIYNGLPFDQDEQKEDIDVVLQLMEKYCIGETNTIYERYVFNNRSQDNGESFDAYVSNLRQLASSCNFGELKDDLIRDRIVCGIQDNSVRKQLLQQPELTLQKAIEKCRASESAKKQIKAMGGAEVNAVSTKSRSGKQRPNKFTQGKPRFIKQCKFCGLGHERKKEKCSAYGHRCSKCKRFNHFEKYCESATAFKRKSKHRVHELSCDSESDDDCQEYQEVECVTVDDVNTIQNGDQNKLFAKLKTKQGRVINFQVDTGATCSILPISKVPKSCDVTPTNAKLRMYNQTPMNTAGKTRIPLTNPKNGQKYMLKVLVVNAEVQPILGFTAAQSMDLIAVKKENISAVSSESSYVPVTMKQLEERFPSVFEGKVGLLRDNVHLDIDTSVPPVKNPPRRVPLAVQDDLKAELDRLESMGVIEKVDTPTDWISSMVCAKKANGKLRVCIDPRPLNKALKRSHYMIPVLDDVLPKLSGAKVFSVVDVQNGYWNLKLDPESSELTTMETPYGRYKWLRLPFGLTSSSEKFQQSLEEEIQIDGTHIIADDILVTGKGDTYDDAVRDHDKNLIALLEECQEKNIPLNKDKMQLRKESVPYMGNLLTNEGIKPDPEKVKAIIELQPPSDVKGTRSLLGMVNYLMRFLPHLSDICEPIRTLTHKDVIFKWSEIHDKAFAELKSAITSAPVLAYFDPSNDNLVIQCDASQYGLGFVLMQNDKPIKYGSRALTSSERNYAQIEKELLAVVYSVEKCRQFTYGRKVTIHTDHKPLEVIHNKPLITAPKRLQRMLLRLQEYDLDIVYKKGTTLHIADYLSRNFLPETQGSHFQDGESVFETEVDVNLAESSSFEPQLITKIREESEKDPAIQELKTMILTGWPNCKEKVPESIKSYFPIRHWLTMQDGIVYNGDRIIIPTPLRPTIIEEIHLPHTGIENSLRRARVHVCWPNMNAEVKDFILKCAICRDMEINKQQKEPMMSHNLPDRPWQHVSTDLLELHNNHYLITVDHYSNFWEIDRLYDTSAKTIIHKLKSHFARYGIPDSLTSDNGPQYYNSEFQKFANTWGFEHKTISPKHQQANGLAEVSVKSAKRLLDKSKKAGNDVYLALLALRNTPNPILNSSPSQRLMSRRTRSNLPISEKLLNPEAPENSREKLELVRKKQKFYYDRHSKPLTPLIEGDEVRIRPYNLNNKEWKPASVIKRLDQRSYEVLTESGKVLRRNRVDIRKSVSSELKKSKPFLEEKQQQQTPPSPPQIEHLDPPSTPKPVPKRVTVSVYGREHTSASPKKINSPVKRPMVKTGESVPKTTRSGRAIKKPTRYE